MTAAPNVVWIYPDEWRHNAVGYAGNRVIHTPHLDALAARGAAFLGAHCESPVCQSSRASVLTARFPSQHGKTQNGPDPADPDTRRLMPSGPFPPADADNILHRLQAAGYHTAEVGKMHFHWGLHSEDELRAYGFDDVAEEYDKLPLAEWELDTPYTRYLADQGLLDRWRDHVREQREILFGRDPLGRPALAEDLDPTHSLDAFIGRQTCDRIAAFARQDRPFFLWVGFVGPHIPYDGPPRFADLYDPATVPMGPVGFDGYPDNAWGEYIRFIVRFLNSDRWGEVDHRLMAKHYYGSCTLIDEQIGQIVSAVERAGLADRTWFLFSSDHGELLGDHGLIHKGVFYDSSVRVPALVVPPPGQPARSTVTTRSLVQAIDLAGTILDIAGADTDGLPARSLVSGAAAETGGRAGRTAVFSQIASFSMVATPDLKLVVETDSLELQVAYDLRRDPEERVDVVAEPSYRAAIDELVETRLRPYVAGELDAASW